MAPKAKPADDYSALLQRLEDLEKFVNEKDNEISDLRQTTESLTEKIRKQDALIEDLRSKIGDDATPSTSSIEPAACVSDTFQEALKNNHDLLVIGDSIIRDVDTNIINPGGDTTIKCLPGARPDDVICEFCELLKIYSFQRIIVHVGTN